MDPFTIARAQRACSKRSVALLLMVNVDHLGYPETIPFRRAFSRAFYFNSLLVVSGGAQFDRTPR